MKILTVSIAPWDRNNNFGKTFCDIFEGMEDTEFLNIYCASGSPNNTVKAEYFQITFNDLVKNLLHKNHKVGGKVTPERAKKLNADETAKYNVARAHHFRVLLWLRRFIWFIGRWKTPELEKNIKDFDADIIFMPIFKESYMNAVQQYCMKVCGKKAVAYYGDDNYSLRQFSLNPFFWFDRLTQRGSVKKTINMCEYMYVVSEVEKRTCTKYFGKKCYICTKGGDFSAKPQLKEKYNENKQLVYTGNLGNHRWEELYHIGQALDALNTKAVLNIYSGTPLTGKIAKKFGNVKSIDFHGRVPVEQIPEIQKSADILVHVESFRLKERCLVYESLSTKIVDHFSCARCTFAVGPEECGSIDHLIRHDSAVVATSVDDIKPMLENLLNNDKIIYEYAIKGFECGIENHDIKKLQGMLKEHFNKYLI